MNTRNPAQWSRYKYVSWHKASKKWQVSIGGTHYGYFDQEGDAAVVAYAQAIRIMTGTVTPAEDSKEDK